MKTKAQKQEDLKKSQELFNSSKAVIFIDFSKVGTTAMRNLRKELKGQGSRLFIIKKRLLGLLFKQNKLAWNDRDFKTSVGAVFASDLESAAGSIYKFFKGLEKEKKVESVKMKMLGGYDTAKQAFLDGNGVLTIGQLPPREILLAQLLGMIAAPIRSFLYVLDQKSKKTS